MTRREREHVRAERDRLVRKTVRLPRGDGRPTPARVLRVNERGRRRGPTPTLSAYDGERPF